jgi:dipeptidyl aminopeptidase/acylaminoacyl peptidase
MNCYRHGLEDGAVARLTDYDRAVWGSTLSPDGDRIAYAIDETDDFENVDVYVASVDSLAADGPAGGDDDPSDARNLEIGEVGAEAAPVEWSPDGDRLLVTDNTDDLARCGVYDLETDSVRWLGDREYEEQPECFVADGDIVVATRARDATAVPVVYDLASGEGRELDLPEGAADFGMAGESVLDADRLLLTHATPTRRPDLLAYDLTDDTTETLVEADHGPFSPAEFADAEYVTFESDGVPDAPAEAVDHDPYDSIEIGALLYASGERPSPLVVNPHGGPRGRDTKSFDLYTQVLVQQGFSVLQVNYRGSTGRGRGFVEELYDDWGGAEQGDVAVGLESVLADREWVDGDRVVVFGGSYGGYSAYWQLVQYPSLYDAGVAWIGLTDLREVYETTMPHFRTELMEKYLGTPEENPGLYEERSPITHAGNLSAPLFVVHGVNDRRSRSRRRGCSATASRNSASRRARTSSTANSARRATPPRTSTRRCGCSGCSSTSSSAASGTPSYSSTSTFSTTTSCSGWSFRSVGTSPTSLTTSIPSRTSPKTAWRSSRWGWASSVTKNCEPFVSGPELAIETSPAPSWRSSGWNSSSNS